MRAAVAFLLTVTMTLAGCFPHDPHKQTIAKVSEGGALIAGIAISAFANTNADCDAMNKSTGANLDDCKSKAQILSTIGVSLILAGLLGFVATISTAEDDAKPAPVITTDSGSGSGSGAPATTPTTNTTNTTNTQATTPTDTSAGSAAGSGSAAPAPATP